MERLGEDEIFCIYERITNREDKNSFSKVCKKFFRVACFHLRSFECHKPFTNNHMKLIADLCQNIENLNLSNGWYYPQMDKSEFDDGGLCAIANACIYLDRVDLSGRLHFKEIGIGSLVRSCKNFRELNLIDCINVADKSLKMIGEATRLEILSLRGCSMISDLGLECLVKGNLKHCLKTLYLTKCDRITDNGIINLKKLVSLRTLSLFRCGANITDYGVVALCELPNLEILYLDFLINITDISLCEIGCKCLKMLVLSLEGSNKITSVGLQALSNLHRLSRLRLVSCYKFSWEEVQSTVLTCSNLSSLSLSRRIKKPMPDYFYSEYFYLVSGNKCTIFWN